MPTERIVPVLVRRLRHDDLDLSAATTDVMYDERGHAHHRTRRGGVKEHDNAHREDEATIVQLRRSCGDQILWVGDERLEVVSIEYVGPRTNCGHPGHHHGRPARVGEGHDLESSVAHDHAIEPSMSVGSSPFRAIGRPCTGVLRDRVVASGPPDSEAADGFYKVTFRVGDYEVDPDFEIVP